MSTLSTTNIKHPSSASNNIVLDSSGNLAVQAGSASTPAIQATGDSNTGIYFSAADTVDIATGGTQRAQLDSSGNLKFNSGYGSVATAYGCRAWVNFNGSSMAIRGSGNISSITDNGVGDYTLNFSTSFPDINYAPTGSCRSPGTTIGLVPQFDVWNTGTLRFYTYNMVPTGYDQTQIAVAIYR